MARMDESSHPINDNARSPVPPSNRRIIIILACMAIVFSCVLIFRNRIRCEWWAYQLAAATAPADQAYYVSCLSASGDHALPAIRRLISDPRPEIRSLGLLLIGQRPIETIIEIIPPLLHDADRDIRESAGTTLAFTGAPAAINLLCDTAVSPNEGVACSALASLGRTSHPAAISALCDALARRPQPLVRAQAAESLAEAISPAPGSNQTVFTWNDAGCDPVAALVRALADIGVFSGELATERQISRVAAQVATQTTQPVARPIEPPARRTVANIAAAGLSKLTGERVSDSPIEDEAAATARFRSLIQARNER